MSLKRKKINMRARRAKRVHAMVRKNTDRARLSVFRSLKHFYAQIIDDAQGNTLVACSTVELTDLAGDKKGQAHLVGLELAKRALQKGIASVAFDRGRFLYHGRVKAFAEGLREGGLQV